MRTIILLLALTVLGCSKDEKATLNGTYQVIGHDNKGHTYSGTIDINGTDMDIQLPGWSMNDITIIPNGMKFSVKSTSKYRTGTGQVVDNDIIVMVQVFYSGGIDQFDFTGSK